jgi:hypothetical protein
MASSKSSHQKRSFGIDITSNMAIFLQETGEKWAKLKSNQNHNKKLTEMSKINWMTASRKRFFAQLSAPRQSS